MGYPRYPLSISMGYIITHCFNGIPAGELEAMKLTDLKEICRSNSLPVSGTKAPAIFGPVWLETSQTSVAVSWGSLLFDCQDVTPIKGKLLRRSLSREFWLKRCHHGALERMNL
jgi:hypothetical protein